MRMIFSLVGLLIVVAIVAILTKNQLSGVAVLPAATSAPATSANIAEQSKQMQTQVKDQVKDAMKAAAEAREKALESGNNDKPVDKTGAAY
jgi:type II secretory pathway component PulJ